MGGAWKEALVPESVLTVGPAGPADWEMEHEKGAGAGVWSRRTPKFGPVAEGRKAGRLSSETETGAEWGRGTGGGFWSGYLREAWWAPQVILDKVGGWRGGGAGQAGPPSTFCQGWAALGRQELAVVTASPPEERGFGSSAGVARRPPGAPTPAR